jgi:dephospho-CoA kinase
VCTIVGLTGPNASGKGEIAAYLGRHGFKFHSLSDIVREEAAAEGLPPEREHLIRIGNQLRERGGPGVLAERILPRLEGRAVVDSIRNPSEVDVLRRLSGFVLIGVTAPLESRFQRSVRRARAGDPRTLDEFAAREAEENTSDPNAQRLQATFELADEVLDNSKDLDSLQGSVRELLERHGCRLDGDAGRAR